MSLTDEDSLAEGEVVRDDKKDRKALTDTVSQTSMDWKVFELI